MAEIFWYIIASLLAGVGTGLVGLSAATVMVPILIVLCPSFAGETGAYQATAIALASDILGSAVTAVTYTRHKNIDLHRGQLRRLESGERDAGGIHPDFNFPHRHPLSGEAHHRAGRRWTGRGWRSPCFLA